MAWTYILRCSDGSYYVGSTRDLDSRVQQHGEGVGAQYTRRRRPVQLVWAVEVERVDEAWALEKQIQNWSRAKREALIDGRLADLPALAARSSKKPRLAGDAHSADGLDALADARGSTGGK